MNANTGNVMINCQLLQLSNFGFKFGGFLVCPQFVVSL